MVSAWRWSFGGGGGGLDVSEHTSHTNKQYNRLSSTACLAASIQHLPTAHSVCGSLVQQHLSYNFHKSIGIVGVIRSAADVDIFTGKRAAAEERKPGSFHHKICA